ncbi:hypothetical protein [Amycolatopsis sp. lyj-346]|uniref:hypothetical protein n=1 Tax=Amycolatopsis sp. lyj-346 TaxID=2789289 RepID=UPI00397E2B8B
MGRTGLGAALAAVAAAVVTVVVPGVAHAQQNLSASQSYGYAGAGIDFTGPSSFHVYDLVVADWGCDGEAPYAQFFYRLGSSTHRWDYTPTKRYDHSGCDSGDFTTYTNLNFTLSGDTIADMGLVICRSSGCHLGNVVHNPYVGG